MVDVRIDGEFLRGAHELISVDLAAASDNRETLRALGDAGVGQPFSWESLGDAVEEQVEKLAGSFVVADLFVRSYAAAMLQVAEEFEALDGSFVVEQ